MSPWGVYACGEWGSVWDLQVLKYHIGRGQEELNHAHGGGGKCPTKIDQNILIIKINGFYKIVRKMVP